MKRSVFLSITFMLMVLMLCSTLSCRRGEDAAKEPAAGVEIKEEGVKPLNVEGALLTYFTEGTGIPCVVFNVSQNTVLRLYSKDLKRHIRFIHACPKYIAKEVMNNMTMGTIVDDIEKVRIALGVEKIAVMGHSMFSVIPPEYGLRYPEHASHLIITGGLPSISAKSDKASNEYWEKEASNERKEIRKRNRAALTEDVMRKLSPTEAFIRDYTADTPFFFYDPRYDMSSFWNGIEINTNFVNRYSGLIYGVDHTDKFHLIKAPVLVISGRYDYSAPYYLWNAVKDLIPNFTFILFEKAGHNPMLETPGEFDKKLIAWIESH